MHKQVEYYVLKQGRTQGPFTKAEVIDQLAGGRFSPEDLGQLDGERHWMPLRRIFVENEENVAEGSTETLESDVTRSIPPVPHQGFVQEVILWWKNTSAGIQLLFQRYPFETGLAFLALGCALLLLSYAPIFIVGPALAGALFGGGLIMLRGRVIAGLMLCAAAVFIPALLWSAFFWVGRVLSISQ